MLSGIHRLLVPSSTILEISLEPAYNLLNSLGAMEAIESNPGLDDWIIETSARLSSEQRTLIRIFFYFIGVEALSNLVEPGLATESFPAFLNALSALDAFELRDTFLAHATEGYTQHLHPDYEPHEPIDARRALADVNYMITYTERVSQKDELIDHDLITRLHALLVDPPKLKTTLIRFLGDMWDGCLAAEWERVRPILQQSVDALNQIDTSNVPIMIALQRIIGRDLNSVLDAGELAKFERIQFIPSRHNGPYITTFGNATTLRIVFGARIPPEMKHGDSPLDNAELLNRLKAMGDETRLNILVALHRQGEMATGEIMDQLDLNKSAASRHLRSLHASGLIHERRDVDGKGKFYTLSDEGIAEMVDTVQTLLR